MLLLLVVNPLARLLWASFQHPETGALTVDNYAAAYGRWRYLEALVNSVVIGLAVAALCTVFGVPMAWAVSRTDMPAKGLVWAAILGTFIMPNYLGAVAWILMAGPNAGWLNRAYVWLTGAAAGPFNVYTKSGLVLVIACYSFPYTFVFTRAALDLISSEMEDAANTLGAGVVRTSLRITLPLALPAILGAFIVVFLEAIALFGAPALIALPGRFQVMTTMLWQMFEFPPKLEVAAARDRFERETGQYRSSSSPCCCSGCSTASRGARATCPSPARGATGAWCGSAHGAGPCWATASS